MRFGTLTSTLSGSLRHFPVVVVPLQVDLSIQVPDLPLAVHVFGGFPPGRGVGPGPRVGGVDDPGSSGFWPGTNLSHSAIQRLSPIVLDKLFERKCRSVLEIQQRKGSMKGKLCGSLTPKVTSTFCSPLILPAANFSS